MTPRLFVRGAARADLAEAFRWYEERQSGLGFEFLRAVREMFARIARAPDEFPIAVDDVRKAPLRRFRSLSTSWSWSSECRCSRSCTVVAIPIAGGRDERVLRELCTTCADADFAPEFLHDNVLVTA